MASIFESSLQIINLKASSQSNVAYPLVESVRNLLNHHTQVASMIIMIMIIINGYLLFIFM